MFFDRAMCVFDLYLRQQRKRLILGRLAMGNVRGSTCRRRPN